MGVMEGSSVGIFIVHQNWDIADGGWHLWYGYEEETMVPRGELRDHTCKWYHAFNSGAAIIDVMVIFMHKWHTYCSIVMNIEKVWTMEK